MDRSDVEIVFDHLYWSSLMPRDMMVSFVTGIARASRDKPAA